MHPGMMPRRFVILDRDGTIVVERHYLADPAQVELIAGAASGLQRMRDLGLGLTVITNQSGVGRGYFDLPTLERVHGRLRDLLEAEGVALDGIYYCPHVPEDDCQCRKPRLGLVERAAADLGFDPRAAFVIGDKACDIELGKAMAAMTILVRTGYGKECETASGVRADFVVDDLAEAGEVIAGIL